MRVYVKPGGQRAYSGHCINLPQHVEKLASVLPRYPKDLSIIVVKMRGRDNTFKDVNVRTSKMQGALLWLLKNNTKYECYLNTPRNDDFKAEEVEPYAVPVAVYEDEVDTSMKVEAVIIGVQQASKSLCCNGCQKRTVEIVDPSKAVCNSCKLMQLPSTCDVSWSSRLLLKPQESHKNLHLKLDSNMTETLVQLLDPTFVLRSKTEDEIIMLILQSNDKSLNLTYDSLTSQVTEIGFR